MFAPTPTYVPTVTPPHYAENDNHERRTITPPPVLTPHQQARADFKKRQHDEKERSQNHHRIARSSMRKAGDQNFGSVTAHRDAKNAQRVYKSPESRREEDDEDINSSRAVLEAEDVSAPSESHLEVNIADLIRPGRTGKKHGVKRGGRRAESAVASIPNGRVSSDDYVSDDVSDQVLKEIFASKSSPE